MCLRLWASKIFRVVEVKIFRVELKIFSFQNARPGAASRGWSVPGAEAGSDRA